MSAEETTKAAILQLRAKALEAYGVIKDLYNSPSKEGDADKIASAAFKLAQYEGAMITLQQYMPNLRQSASEAAVLKAAAEAKLQEEGLLTPAEDPITAADIAAPPEMEEETPSAEEKEAAPEGMRVSAENSPTFKRSQTKRRTRKKKTTKEAKEESE